MRNQGREIDCLDNQETGEQPQLYFSHQWKVGNACQLAMEIKWEQEECPNRLLLMRPGRFAGRCSRWRGVT